MPDSIRELTAEICAFRDRRNWRQFHGAKEMSIAIVAEAGELLQHFVWQTPEQSERRAAERRDEVAEEMADISMLLFELAADLQVDLAQAIRAKLSKNEVRYPVERSRDSNRKYNEL